MPKFCPTCGKQLQFENAEICPNCGVRVKSPPSTKKQDDTGKNILILITAGVALVFFTVIIAAVIAAFVFGMAGNIQKIKVVAATVQQPAGNLIVVTYQGGQDADQIRQFTVTVTDSSGKTQTKDMGSAYQTEQLQIGSKYEFSGAFSGRDHVVAVGIFSDGSQQVILDTYV